MDEIKKNIGQYENAHTLDKIQYIKPISQKKHSQIKQNNIKITNFPENNSDPEDQKEITFGESTTQKRTKPKDVYSQILDVPLE